MSEGELRTKHLRAERSDADGTRVYISRRWPRGVAKGERFNEWMKALAPSTELLDAFGAGRDLRNLSRRRERSRSRSARKATPCGLSTERDDEIDRLTAAPLCEAALRRPTTHVSTVIAVPGVVANPSTHPPGAPSVPLLAFVRLRAARG